MRYLSVCSGIEAASVAWRSLGWTAAGFAEIDKFPSAVLAHHYPTVRNFGDFTTIQETDVGTIDLLVGGTPCQSFSIAGLRGGLGDDRGNLALEFCRLALRTRPRWVVWENVPGVLSSNKGRDFGSILGALAECGYGFAYRVLDAQFFGLAQRRKRVFVVGYLGDWRPAAAVLFERESLRGDPPPSRKAGQRVAGTLEARAGTGGYDPGAHGAASGHLIPQAFGGGNCSGDVPVAAALTAHGRRQDFEVETFITSPPLTSNPYGHHESREGLLVAHTLRAEGHDASEDGTARGVPLVPVAFAQNQRDELRTMDVAGALASEPGMKQQTYVALPILEAGARTGTSTDDPRAGIGIGDNGDPMFTLQSGKQHAVAIGRTDTDTLYRNLETSYSGDHASAPETDTYPLLRELRKAVGEEAFAEWGLGVSHSLQPPEVLRPEVHGGWLRGQTENRDELGGNAQCRAGFVPSRSVQSLWGAGCVGRAPSGWKPPEQLARQLGTHLSRLPYSRASVESFLRDMWRASEGLGLLREALSAAQEAWRPNEGDPEAKASLQGMRDASPQQGAVREALYAGQASLAVRRLTPKEAARLQGFPDNYLDITYRGKPAADGPRYKALGNSMAVPVMRWIGQRIELVETLLTR